MKTIIVTGTPGTGKTTIAKKLAKKLNYYYIDANKIISKYKLSEGYDRKRRTKIVDVKKLNKFLINYIKQLKKQNFDFFKNKKYMESALSSNVKNQRFLSMIENRFAIYRQARSTRTLTKSHIKKIINNKKLNKKNKQRFNGVIIDSHLSHYLPKKYVDFCVVTKCDIKELNKRLKRKKFHKSKIQENLQAEIFYICHTESMKRKHKVIVVDTTKGFKINNIAKQLGIK